MLIDHLTKGTVLNLLQVPNVKLRPAQKGKPAALEPTVDALNDDGELVGNGVDITKPLQRVLLCASGIKDKVCRTSPFSRTQC